MSHFMRVIASNAGSYVTSASRYKDSKVIQYTENKFLTFETYKRPRRRTAFMDGDQFMEITPEIEYRPDLVSADVYGTPDFWCILMEANGMKDIMEFKKGRNIRLPGNVL